MNDFALIRELIDQPCTCTKEQQSGIDPTLCARCTAAQEYERIADDIKDTLRSLRKMQVV